MAVGRAGERYAERVVPQIMERGGLPAGLLQDLAQGTTSKIFIGSKSRAWDKDAAELAKKLDKKGESAEAIWEKTGTFKSPDGKWRQEISDQNIELRSENIGRDREGNPIFLPVTEGNASRVMAHPELYDAYPFLKKVNTEIGIKPKTAGSAEYGDEGRFIEAYGPTDEEIKSALVHEMQHQVQNREGMAAGSGFISGDEKDFQRYLRAAGEAEARAVQARRNLSMEERRKLFPLSSYDVPISELDASLPKKLDFGFLRSLLDELPKKSAPRQEALDTAQRNAALPVEEGGLGLPKDNTPEMRAEAMGYNTPAYHGTTVWEAEDGRKLGDIEAFNRLASTEIVGRKPSIDQMGIWASDRPDELGAGMYSGSQGAIYPLLLRMENPKTTSFEQMARTASNLSTNKALGATEVPRVSDVEPYRQRLKEQGYDSLMIRAKEGSPYTEFVDQTGYVLLEPSQVRSRFAAFDPMRRNEADILAGVLPLGLLADEEQRKKLYELMPSLLGQ
jgi:hypothetical protein